MPALSLPTAPPILLKLLNKSCFLFGRSPGPAPSFLTPNTGNYFIIHVIKEFDSRSPSSHLVPWMLADNKPVGWHPSSLTRLCQLLYLTLPINHAAGPLVRVCRQQGAFPSIQLCFSARAPAQPCVLGDTWELQRAAPESGVSSVCVCVPNITLHIMPKTMLVIGMQ